ncbi:MAG: Mov34/MPN/PAD-1 family protein, partial [Bryobacteraceae bacterium]|nr:Mov34/MPN/PAD-1 family protein [Bryobacteraceae bacterium]
SPHNSFLIDPEDILIARRLALDSNLDLIGFYHSHPNAPAYFSPRDLSQCWPGYPNLVVSIFSGRPITAKAFIASSDLTHATEIPITIPSALTPS